MRVLLACAALLAAQPATAAAAPPANDKPGGAVEFTAFTAGNLPDGETAAEREGVAELAEATADAGVARCLGRGSFAKTVWFKVPAADSARLVRVEASSPAGGTSEVPDLALFVGGQSKLAQSCDGAAAGKLMTSAAAVEARVPAGQAVLVQVGRSSGQTEQRVVASLRTDALEGVKAPAGDKASGKVPALPVGSRRTVVLGGATLTKEDPAQPACPAAATVWRRTVVPAAGRYRVSVRGTAAGSATAFVGAKPTADSAKACVNRRSAKSALAMTLRLKRGAVLWTRVGADDTKAGSRVKAIVKRLKA